MGDGEQDTILLVEPELVQQVSSFALDIGASLAKVVFRSKKDYKDGQPIFEQGDTSVGRLRLALLQRLEPEALIQFIKDNVDRPEVTSTPSSVPATGCGSSIYKEVLEKALNIKLQQISEWDGFAAGVRFLQKNDSREPLCHETSAAGEADAMEKLHILMGLMANLEHFSDMKIGPASNGKEKQAASAPSNGNGNQPQQNPDSTAGAGDRGSFAESTSPCLVAMMGSSIGWLQIGGPGSISAVDMSATGGCTFVGLGRLLTRSNKTFLELIDLAKQGDQRKVDICGNDLKPDVDQGDVYTAIATDLSICHFGKALTNPESEFKDADLLASLLKTICTDLIRATRLNAQVNQIEKVYIAGNFVNNDHVRRIMTQEIIVSKLLSKLPDPPDIRFLRHGGYMGAIGAMMVDAKKTFNQ